MNIISHRGNLNGSNSEKENTKHYIKKAMKAGFDVEIDVWFVNDKLYLGHDEPNEVVTTKFLYNTGKKYDKKFWIHCKNKEAFEYFNNYETWNFFWHENDKITMTSQGIPWCYPGTFISTGITVVLGENEDLSKVKTLGICTDYPIKYSKRSL